MKKLIIILLFIIFIIIGIKVITNKKENNNNNNNIEISNETLEINSNLELFPNEKINIDYQNEDGIKTKLNVMEVKIEDNKKIVTTRREEKQDKETLIVEMKYEVTADKVIESGKYILDSKEVSKIYPQEIIKGNLVVGSEWKSVDGLTITKVVSTTKDKVILESSRDINIYEENSKTPVKKKYVEIRTFEKGKGIISYKSETR